MTSIEKPDKQYETIELEFSDEELLRYMKLAHEMDITFNQFIELALNEMLKDVPEDT